MVKRCAWGKCNTASRCPKKLQNGVYFIPLHKTQRDKKKCVMWIRLCCRPEYKLNLSLSPPVCILKFWIYTPPKRNVVPFFWKKLNHFSPNTSPKPALIYCQLTFSHTFLLSSLVCLSEFAMVTTGGVNLPVHIVMRHSRWIVHHPKVWNLQAVSRNYTEARPL